MGLSCICAVPSLVSLTIGFDGNILVFVKRQMFSVCALSFIRVLSRLGLLNMKTLHTHYIKKSCWFNRAKFNVLKIMKVLSV